MIGLCQRKMYLRPAASIAWSVPLRMVNAEVPHAQILPTSLMTTIVMMDRDVDITWAHEKGEQGWRSGKSTRLPPMWPGFDSRSLCHTWVEFVLGSRLCSEWFFSGYSGFPLSSKTNISKFQFDPDTVDEEPPCGCATANSHFILF